MNKLWIWLLLVLALVQAAWARPRADHRRIDAYALAAPASVEGSVEQLARYLDRGARTQEEKARAIYRWLTDRIAYDEEGFRSGHAAQDSGSALSQRKAVCAGFSALYLELANKMGLQAERVTGLSKGYGFDADAASAKNQKHAWVAVKLGGVWFLVDPTWGAGSLSRDGRFQKRFNEYWFRTPPAQMIYDHFPDEPRWQLLNSPWSASRFRSSVRTSHFFFEYGLEPVSHREFEVVARGDTQLRFRGPEDLLLTANLLGGDDRPLAQDAIWTLVSHRGRESTVLLRCPQPGLYKLRIYGRLSGGHISQGRQSYDWMAEYRVRWTRSGRAVAGFPRTFSGYPERQAQLQQPTQAVLSKERSSRFRILIPGAQSAKLVFTDGEQSLISKGGSVFEGSCTPPAGKLTIFALFPDDNRYFGLVEYDVR